MNIKLSLLEISEKMDTNYSIGQQNNSVQKFNLQELCTASEMTLHRNIVLNFIHLIPICVSLFASLALLIIYCRNRVAFHSNLLILFSAIIAISFLNNAGFFCINFTYIVFFVSYKNACDILIPLWRSALFVGPYYAYSIAYPLLHFCIVIERIRATVLAGKYEREGQRLGIWMVIIIAFFSVGFAIYVICSAFADPDMSSHSQSFFNLTSKYNNLTIFYANIFTLLLTILTAICACRITQINRRLQHQFKQTKFKQYSLSRNYQLNENVLALRLIMPLDVLYALLYSIYTAMMVIIRAYKPALSMADFIHYFILAQTLLYFYSAFTLIVYIRFIKFVSRCQHRPVEPKPQVEQAKIYFRQLEAQWQ